MSQPTVLLLTSQAARILAVAPETVRLWERRGLLHATRTASGLRLFSRHDVEALARSRALATESAAKAR